MTVSRKTLVMLACTPLLLAAATAHAQQQPAPAQPKGAELVTTKCFQCHTQAMWQDQRQDTRAWEANLYRMVGRGALWTTEEIKQMAEYLGTDFGPNVPPAAPATPR
jgi:mono/diheme cytochrome c family protein